MNWPTFVSCFSYRRSGNFTHDVAMKAMKPVGQVVPQFRALYGGSNVSLMVSNELYGEVPDNKQDKCVPLPASTRAMMPLPPVQGDAASCVKASGATALPACELEGDYAEVNSLCGDKPEESGACGGEDTYMDVSEIRRLKAEQGVLKDEAATTRL
ncbi:uncharacterized protein [Littorina saxatilis]|uniref:uncharacterized protein n=1 Tax=Littorina saxatilis TaxID=31220 RepID=UPI0038B4876C